MKKFIQALILSILLTGCGSDSNHVYPEYVQPDFTVAGDGFVLDNNYIAVKSYPSEIITIYDLTTQKVIREINFPQRGLYDFDLSDNLLVWSSTNGDTNTDIFLYDIRSGEKKQITNDQNIQSNPKIVINYVVWLDHKNSADPFDSLRLFIYDLNTGKKKAISTSVSSRTYSAGYSVGSNKIIWETQSQSNDKMLNILDVSSNIKIEIPSIVVNSLHDLEISNEIIYGIEFKNTNSDIIAYDLNTKKKKYFVRDKFRQEFVKVSEDYISWVDDGGARDKQSTPDLPRISYLLYLRNLNDNTERCLTSRGNFRGLDMSNNWLAYQTTENSTEEIRVIKYR